MKKTALMTALIFLSLTLMTGSAFATSRPPTGEITVDISDEGVVSVTGSSASEFGRATQFCTDEVNNEFGCGDNIEIAVEGGNQYPLDKDGLRDRQQAFNLHFKDNGDWLRIPSGNVHLGKNVAIVPGAQGHRFVYTGPVPAK